MSDKPEGYIPRDQRRKILLLSDDMRMPSGVGVMSKEIVMGTAHKYNWVQLAAGVNHPEAGKLLDASDSLSKDMGFDAYLRIFPYNGYGDQGMIRRLLMMEKPDAILHFTDSRYWEWLYHMEAEIREHIPIMFYHVWDDLPYPQYNELYYRSCDYISCISRQTYNIVKNVVSKEPKFEPWQIHYIGHGVDSKVFYNVPTTDIENTDKIEKMKTDMFGENPPKFIVLYNNRNIRRKMPGDVLLAFNELIMSLPEHLRNDCGLLLHTNPIDQNGTDLPRVIKDITPDIRHAFSAARVAPTDLNLVYNMCDVVINMASNEGFGLSTLEGLMAERLMVATVTGGLQDQMGFIDQNGKFVNEDDHFCKEWGSNHDGKYRTHGEWVFPLFPTNRALVGSPPTPYIFDDRCSWQEAGQVLRKIYDMPVEERERRGKLGREYCLSEGFNNAAMVNKFIDGIDRTFDNWKPRKRFDIYKA